MRINVPRLSAAAVLVLAACQTKPAIETSSGLRVAPELAQLRPSDIAVLPVEDRTPDSSFASYTDAFRQAVIESLAQRLYAPLGGAMVDTRLLQAGKLEVAPVDPNWVGGVRNAFDEDAVLGIRVRSWDVARLNDDSRVGFVAEVLMLGSETGVTLWAGRLEGSVKSGGSGPSPIGAEAQIASCVEVMAQALIRELPMRQPGA